MPVLPVAEKPTAQALDAEVAATPARPAALPALGLGWTDQRWPSQCSTRVRPVPVLKYSPTAQALDPEVAATWAR